MKERLWIVGIFALALASLQGSQAKAQFFGYPPGFGAFGWGGWGGETVQGNIAQGLGMYAMGAGFYNESTAVANSINTDTVMRWNQYVYESQKEANRIHHARLAQERFNNTQAI